VTAFPQDGLDSEGLLKNADLALYEAKRSGRGRWCIFRQDHAQARAENDSLTDGLRQAIASNAIQVAFQPKRRTKGGHAGFEALARWNDGTRDVPPSQFIAAAEESGLIIPLGAAVMEAALARLRALRMCGATTGRVAVNVASAQLMDPSFLPDTLDALRRHDLGPGDLELEVTETVLLGRSAERIEQTLRDFRDRGVALALDDFGTGLASLSHLARLPLTSLKIDRSFVSEIGRGDRGGLIARVIIGLARGLGLESIAEGVETVEQVAFLQAEGCDVVQGYLYARPLATEDEILGYLRDHSSMAAARPRLRRV
jgi:EAL domain-containing protein (putative c-di-GMP-specific phosphodiesterase class I)